MRKDDVKVGGIYLAKVSGKRIKVRIDSVHTQGLSGRTFWQATNLATGRTVTIRSAQRLSEVPPERPLPTGPVTLVITEPRTGVVEEKTFCTHERHGTPCPQPCAACDEECKA